MRKFSLNRIGNLKRRILSGVLLACMALSVVVLPTQDNTACAIEKASVNGDYATGTVTIWEWTRVDDVSKIPVSDNFDSKCVMFVWEANGKRYATTDTGNLKRFRKVDGVRIYDDDHHMMDCIIGEDVTDDPYIAMGTKMFYTTDNRDALYYVSNGKNGAGRGVQIHFASSKDASGSRIYMGTDNDEYNAMVFRTWGEEWSHAGYYKYWNVFSQGNGQVSVYHNDDADVFHWDDDDWGYDGQYIFCDSEDESLSNLHKFYMYIGQPVNWSCIEDYTVKAGQVLNIDDNVILNGTLTVEPGGAVSIEGQFFNNGIINNYGTIVVQKDSCISTFDPSDKMNVQSSVKDISTVGTINNFGGSVKYSNGEYGEGAFILLQNARYALTEGYGSFSLTYGATLVNNGIMVLPQGIICSSSSIWNRDNGHMFIGYDLKSNITAIGTLALKNAGTDQAILDGLECASSLAKIYFVNEKQCKTNNEGVVLQAIKPTGGSEEQGTELFYNGTTMAAMTARQAYEANVAITVLVDDERAEYVAQKTNEVYRLIEWYDAIPSEATGNTLRNYMTTYAADKLVVTNSDGSKYETQYYQLFIQQLSYYDSQTTDTGKAAEQVKEYMSAIVNIYKGRQMFYVIRDIQIEAEEQIPYNYYVYYGDDAESIVDEYTTILKSDHKQFMRWLNYLYYMLGPNAGPGVAREIDTYYASRYNSNYHDLIGGQMEYDLIKQNYFYKKCGFAGNKVFTDVVSDENGLGSATTVPTSFADLITSKHGEYYFMSDAQIRAAARYLVTGQ